MKKIITGLVLLSVMGVAVSSCCSGDKAQSCDSAENQVVKAIMDRRSIRAYKPEAVAREQMQTILECGVNAPSGMNRQPWEVRVVDNPEFINGVTELFKSVDVDERKQQMISDPTFKNMFRNAPTVVFIASKDGKNQLDCGLMVENMLLAAQSMGIGSCCLGSPANFFRTPIAAEYLKRLNFSEGYELVLAVGFGYPDETPEAKPRDVSKFAFVD